MRLRIRPPQSCPERRAVNNLDLSALVKAAAEQCLTRTLVFHHRIAEAEAFAAGLPEVAAKLHASEPELYPKQAGTGRRPVAGHGGRSGTRSPQPMRASQA